MSDFLPHVREPAGEPDVCAYCCEEWVDVNPAEACPLRSLGLLNLHALRAMPRLPAKENTTNAEIAELVALVNARLPAGSTYCIDPTLPVRFGQHWGSEHYWTLTDGCATASWQQGRPTPECPVADPCIEWTEDRAVALDRILAVERRRAAALVIDNHLTPGAS
jgi:hypothetical protein